MKTIDCANTNTNTKREWKRKACVIDLSKFKKDEPKQLFRKRKMFVLAIITMVVLASSTLIANAQNIRTSARVLGWYEVSETSNERLDIKTNMQVYVNGQSYIAQGDY